MAARARIFTIPPGAAFLATFVDACLAGKIISGVAGDDPAQLSATTIFVPTRRSAQALAREFARALDHNVVLLPRIVPLGRLEDIETSLAFGDGGFGEGFTDALPDAVGETERRLVLTRLILAWASHLRYAIISMDASGKPNLFSEEPLLVATSPAQAWRLSGDLAGLIDDMIIEGVAWGALEKLVPDAYDQYWRITLDFLKIAVEIWPKHLAERHLIDAAERQKHLVDAEIARLGAIAQDHPVIAIGSTGANPATARLLGAIARQGNGALVLPGLDMHLDEVAWSLIPGDAKRGADPADGHPQAMLHRLLRTLGVTRADVVELGAPSLALQARARFVSEAMRPAETTDAWLDFARAHRATLPQALAEVTLIEAADEREEALCLAIEARRLLESPDVTGALITPDRALARRVKSEMARWNIDVDDSAGDSLALAPVGVLARLVLAAASPDASAIDALALLSHPLAHLGHERGELQRLTGLLEIGVWRVVASDGLACAELMARARAAAQTREAHPAAAAMSQDDWDAAKDLLERLQNALAPLRQYDEDVELPLWIAAHRAAIADIIAPHGAGEDALAIEDVFEAASAPALPSLPVNAADYAALIEQIFNETVVRPSQRAHPRFKILGPLEARLLHADVFLLGGLDESIWPPPARNDPFLNRPMRAALGLGPPERRIGQTAHDFVQAIGAPRIVLSRARKRGGAPTTPSRFLQRMAALAGEDVWRVCQERGAASLALARAIDVKAGKPVGRPMPRPPLDLRPTSLSVTRIETLRRDPYGIYAERILHLAPLGPLGVEIGAREIGNLLHELMADFARKFPAGQLLDDEPRVLREMALEKFEAVFAKPEFHAFLWPRIEAALTRIMAWEMERREVAARIDVEQSGRLAISLSDNSTFHLTAQADRIETLREGGLVAIDFKSGRLPSLKEVAAGFSPQLTLEAAMIERGAFAGIVKASVVDAIYYKILSADRDKPQSLNRKDAPFAALVEEHFVELRELLDQFRNPQTPYPSRPFPQFINAYSDYDHLARVKEWSVGASEGGEA